jgi:membrane protein DedA with SNARE-associated domain
MPVCPSGSDRGARALLNGKHKESAPVTDWITGLIEQMGYFGIALLMFLENLFPPLPSEVIMPMAGFTASKGNLNIVGVLVAGTLGTLSGALFWYTVARKLGEERLRHWADRHGRWITLSPEDIDQLDDWFDRHSRWAVPIGHLVPGIRTLISIPAGIFGMGVTRFILLTVLGAGVWTSALGVAGYVLGSQFDQVDRYLGPASTAIMGAILVWYLYRVATFKRGRKAG